VNVELLERANAALGKLREEVVFLGAATIPLWLTDPAAPPPRPTKDVDLGLRYSPFSSTSGSRPGCGTRAFVTMEA